MFNGKFLCRHAAGPVEATDITKVCCMLYADWQELVGEDAAAKAVEKSAKKAERSTGAGGGGVSDGLTAAQQRELDEWNRSYPQMKMTAKEFFER